MSNEIYCDFKKNDFDNIKEDDIISLLSKDLIKISNMPISDEDKKILKKNIITRHNQKEYLIDLKYKSINDIMEQRNETISKILKMSNFKYSDFTASNIVLFFSDILQLIRFYNSKTLILKNNKEYLLTNENIFFTSNWDFNACKDKIEDHQQEIELIDSGEKKSLSYKAIKDFFTILTLFQSMTNTIITNPALCEFFFGLSDLKDFSSKNKKYTKKDII